MPDWDASCTATTAPSTLTPYVGHSLEAPCFNANRSSIVLANPYVTLAISTLVFIGPWILIVPLVLLLGLFFIVLIILGFGVAGIVGGYSSL